MSGYAPGLFVENVEQEFCAVSGKRLLLPFISECLKLMPQIQIKALGFLLNFNYVVLNACLNVPESLEKVAK